MYYRDWKENTLDIFICHMEQMALEETYVQVAKELTQPAGASPRFSSSEQIAKNHDDFVLECHKTWKKWHIEAIRQILFFEGFAKAEKERPTHRLALEWVAYNQALWRRVNDTLIWTVMGCQRHLVKRLCLYRPRPSLTDSNPSVALDFLGKVNSSDFALAIWNDATTCVDVGDLTVVPDGRHPQATFLELKEGAVNEAIAELLVGVNSADLKSRVEVFEAKYGKKGAAQLRRVLNQKVKSDQAMDLLNKETGIDPVTGRHMRVIEVSAELTKYDDALGWVLKASLDRRTAVTEVVDGCVWLYANADKRLSLDELRNEFSALLAQRIAGFSQAANKRRPSDDRNRIASLSEGFYHPLALPLFLRNLDPSIVGAVAYGDLMFRVLLYIDWASFGNVVRQEGADFNWSSIKDGRRARALRRNERPSVIDGRLGLIRAENGDFAVTDPMLVQILFDGLKPRTAIKHTIEALTTLDKDETD